MTPLLRNNTGIGVEDDDLRAQLTCCSTKLDE